MLFRAPPPFLCIFWKCLYRTDIIPYLFDLNSLVKVCGPGVFFMGKVLTTNLNALIDTGLVRLFLLLLLG